MECGAGRIQAEERALLLANRLCDPLLPVRPVGDRARPGEGRPNRQEKHGRAHQLRR